MKINKALKMISLLDGENVTLCKETPLRVILKDKKIMPKSKVKPFFHSFGTV
jgi:hypothetical protein